MAPREMVEETAVVIHQRPYQLTVHRTTPQPAHLPRLLVVAYQPTAQSRQILHACIQAIQTFTPPNAYELWVIDNCSPPAHAHWLHALPGVNVIFNHTPPLPPDKQGWWGRWRYARRQHLVGSYANALALELAVRILPPDTQFIMPLHMDTMPCHLGWLDFLQAHLTPQVRAAGVRLDAVRVPDGVLHVLGYLVDFQLFRALNLDFFPQLPQYDVGDLVSVRLRQAGYQLFACRNTLWQPELRDLIPATSPLRLAPVDRSFNDNDEVIFLHLGRGVRKSSGEAQKGFSPEEWLALAGQLRGAADQATNQPGGLPPPMGTKAV